MVDVYRPLCVMVEALEEKCRHLLDVLPAQHQTPRFSMEELQATLRRIFDDENISCSKYGPEITISHWCTLCKKLRSTKVDQILGHGDDLRLAKVIVDATQRMMLSNCHFELNARI